MTCDELAAIHAPPLPIPLLHSEWRRGCPKGGRGGASVHGKLVPRNPGLEAAIPLGLAGGLATSSLLLADGLAGAAWGLAALSTADITFAWYGTKFVGRQAAIAIAI